MYDYVQEFLMEDEASEDLTGLDSLLHEEPSQIEEEATCHDIFAGKQ